MSSLNESLLADTQSSIIINQFAQYIGGRQRENIAGTPEDAPIKTYINVRVG